MGVHFKLFSADCTENYFEILRFFEKIFLFPRIFRFFKGGGKQKKYDIAGGFFSSIRFADVF